jgi:hypothetical protein
VNAPTHIACGALLAQLLATSVSRRYALRRSVMWFVAFGCVGLGIACHLLLDLLPHYAWIVYLEWFNALPYHWLLREALFGLVVAVPALILAGRFWPFVMLGIAGGMYPDVEKVLAVDLHVPAALILFDWHSRYLSTRTGGLPMPFLIAFECFLIVTLLLMMCQLKRRDLRERVR